MMKKRLVASFVVVMVVGVRGAVVAGWDFAGVDAKDGTGIETNVAPFTFFATTSEVQHVSAKLTLGAGVNPTTSNDKYGFKISISDSTNSLAGAIAMDHYMEFSLTVEEGYELNLASIEMLGDASPTGCSNVVLMTSVDGFVDGQQIATATNANTTGGFDTDISGFGAPIDLTASKYQEITGSISFRIYGWGVTSSAGETALRTYGTVSDDLVVYGEVVEYSGSGELFLSIGTSNESTYVFAVFDGTARTNYVLQSSTDMDSNSWSAVSTTFAADAKWVIETTNTVECFRAIAQ
jgi:hypothetical protein